MGEAFYEPSVEVDKAWTSFLVVGVGHSDTPATLAGSIMRSSQIHIFLVSRRGCEVGGELQPCGQLPGALLVS